MFKMVKRNEKGFTLIELMIVIAIIGILAAIAIPQFAAYRVRGYNSSAQSDIKNLATSQAAFFSDWQIFGVSGTAAAAGGGAGALITGPGSAANTIMITGADNQPVPVQQTLTIGLGNGVSLISSTDANRTSFTAVTKHRQGDTYFAADSDSSAVFIAQDPARKGLILAAADCPASTTPADNFNGIALYATTWSVK